MRERRPSSCPMASMKATNSFWPESGRTNLICRLRRGWRMRTRSSWQNPSSNALLEHAVPAIALRVLELLILIELPFLKQHGRRVLPQKVGGHSAFEGASEEHGGPGGFRLATIQITMAVAARTFNLEWKTRTLNLFTQAA